MEVILGPHSEAGPRAEVGVETRNTNATEKGTESGIKRRGSAAVLSRASAPVGLDGRTMVHATGTTYPTEAGITSIPVAEIRRESGKSIVDS